MTDLIIRNADLLPCPFCGGEASARGKVTYHGKPNSWWADGTPVETAYYCNCMTCGATCRGIVGGSQTIEEAIEKWNRRALPAQAPAVTECAYCVDGKQADGETDYPCQAQAPAVKVKLLTWSRNTSPTLDCDLVDSFGLFQIAHEDGVHLLWSGNDTVCVAHPTLEAAKAAAQADYAARILAAIEPAERGEV